MNQTKAKTRMLRFIWGVIPWIMVCAIVAFVVVMFGRIKEEKTTIEAAKKAAMKKDVPAVRVITLTLQPEKVEDKLSLPAEVEPFEDLWVKSEAQGQILDILVEEGQRVKKGQLLVELDDRDYRSRLDRIDANLKLAQLDHDRYAILAKKNIAAKSKLDETVAKLKELTAQQNEAKLSLSRTRISAPISGRLNEIKAKKGDLLMQGQSVLQILQISKVKVKVGVPESDVAAVFDIKGADVVIEALNNRRVNGRKVFLSRQPQSLARLFDLELELPNPDGRILPGMFARVELVKKVFDEALIVPLYAVITQNDEKFVFIEKGGRAEKRPVQLGVLTGWQVQIKSGLSPGERVIVVGHRFLDTGQDVDVIKNVDHPDEIFKS